MELLKLPAEWTYWALAVESEPERHRTGPGAALLRLVAAARYLGMSVLELLELPAEWVYWANMLEEKEAWAVAERKKRYGPGGK